MHCVKGERKPVGNPHLAKGEEEISEVKRVPHLAGGIGSCVASPAM